MDPKKLIEQAAAHQRAGRTQEAEQLLEKIVRNHPSHEAGVRALAMLQARSGRVQQAEATLKKAIDHQPHNAHFYEMLADVQLHIDPRAAEQSARAALKFAPSSAPLMCMLGDTLLAQRRLGEAIEVFRLAVRVRPNHSFPLSRLAQALRYAGRPEEAIDIMKRAVAIDQVSPEVRHSLGSAYMEAGMLDEAEAALRESIRLKEDYIPGYGTLGTVLQRKGEREEAEQMFRRGLEIQPNNTLLHLSLGHLMVDLGRTRDADAAFRRALELDPRFMPALVSLSSLGFMHGKPFEAMELAQRAVRVAPGSADSYAALGTALHTLGRNEEALAALAQAWQIGGKPSAGSNLLHASNYVTNLTPQQVFQAHRAWANRHAENVPATFTYSNDRDPERRLRVGYISPDFRGHAVSFFVEPLLLGHDRARVEVYCYSGVGIGDAVTERLKSRADHWREIALLSHQQVAEMIHADGIDVMVDLAGHTNNNRLLVMARRPAPVQVTYQGYPNTTGLSAIAYRITDAHADPPGQTDEYHSEQLIRLPRTAWCYRPLDDAPDVTDLPAKRSGQFTFGSFNRLAKVSPITAELWSRAVKAVPGARLMFKTAGLDEPATEKYVRETFARYGLEGEQLVLVGSDPSMQAHLERYGQIDLALDCYPYHGTTTSCEAMWMGVPSIVLVGPTHVSRVGLSLLSNIGLPEFAAMSADQFVEVAVNAAKDLDRLAELRRTMRDRMRGSPLMDVQGFCREIEDAYREMWRKWCATPSPR